MRVDSQPPAARPAGRSAALIRAALGVAIGLAITAGTIALVHRVFDDRTQADFDLRVAQSLVALNAFATPRAEAVGALRLLFAHSEAVDFDEFLSAAGDLRSGRPDIVALEWAPLVHAAQLPAFLNWARENLDPDFNLRDRGGRPSAPADIYLPVTLVDPFELNQPAVGFNLLGGSTRDAVVQAAATGRATMSGTAPLFRSDRSDIPGFLVYAPVFAPDHHVNPGRSALRALDGVVVGVFDLEAFLTGALLPSVASFADLLVEDTAAGDLPLGLVTAAGTVVVGGLPSAVDFGTGLSRSTTIQLWQRDWRLHFRASPVWLASRRPVSTPFLALFGLSASLAAGLLVYGRCRRAELVESLVGERTAQLENARAALARDILRREQVEDQLRASAAQLHAIADHSPAAILLRSADGSWLLANPAFERLTGIPAGSLTGARSAPGPDPLAALFDSHFHAIRADPRPIRGELRLPGNPGGRFWIVESFPARRPDGGVFAVGTIIADLTTEDRAAAERLALERRWLSAQKSESLGVLARAIAHDFNNLLAALLNQAAATRLALPEDTPARPGLDAIEEIAHRAAELCQQILAFGGDSRIERTRVDLGALILGMQDLLRSSVHRRTRLHVEPGPDVPPVLADITQVRQVILNLVLNASEATTASGGNIRLSTGSADLDEEVLAMSVGLPSLPAGRYAWIQVADDGSGMPTSTLARIFEPHFTTKESGRGIGLAAVLAIVRRHHGAVFVDSTPGSGTVIRTCFAVAGDVGGAPARISASALLATDEPALRFEARTALEARGFEVVTVTDGAAALRSIEDRGTPFDILVLDSDLDRLSGTLVAARVGRRRQAPPIVLLSSSPSPAATPGTTATITKPCDPATLVNAVLNALEFPRNGTSVTRPR